MLTMHYRLSNSYHAGIPVFKLFVSFIFRFISSFCLLCFMFWILKMIKGTFKQMLEAYLYSFVYTSNPTYVSVCGKGMNFECVCVSC